MKIMATSFKRSQAQLQHPVWTLMGMSGTVSCGVTTPFSWVLAHTRFCLCLRESVSAVLCKFWQLMATFSKRAYAIPKSAAPCHNQFCAPRAPAPAAVHCWPVDGRQETLRHSSGSVSVGSLGPGVHKLFLRPLSISGGYGV